MIPATQDAMDLKSRPTVVELFALPGAGKTTVAHRVAASAGVTTRKALSARWAANSTVRRASHVLRGLNLRRIRTAAQFAARAPIRTPEGLFRLLRLVAKAGWLGSHRGVILLDQGFLQDLWSILVSGRSTVSDPAMLSALIEVLYEDVDAQIVILDVEPDIASQRIQTRTHGDSRFDDLPAPELLTALHSARRLQHQIIEAARLAGLPVQIIDGSAPIEQAADELLALLPANAPTAGTNQAAPRRISIVGSTGSGKSYLARQLGDRLDLPVCELDELRRLVAIAGPQDHGFVSRVADAAGRDTWIIDGHYRGVRQLIWERADLVVWLNYSLPVIATRLLGRFRRRRSVNPDYGKAPGPSPLPGAPENATWKSRIARLARTLRERREYGRVLGSAEYRHIRVIELRSPERTRRWLQDL